MAACTRLRSSLLLAYAVSISCGCEMGTTVACTGFGAGAGTGACTGGGAAMGWLLSAVNAMSGVWVLVLWTRRHERDSKLVR